MKKYGVLFGVGVGPGDPELMTIKGASTIAKCRHIFAPTAAPASESVALNIAKKYLGPNALIHSIHFPMARVRTELEEHWNRAASSVVALLKNGEDVCFLTLGDPLLYSTYIYLVRAVKAVMPDVVIETIPGVMALAAAAALTNFSLGEGDDVVTIIPVGEDLDRVRRALTANKNSGTVVLMKIGKRLGAIIELLKEIGSLDQSVFVARAGMGGERIVTDLSKLTGEPIEAGYLAIILVHGSKNPSC